MSTAYSRSHVLNIAQSFRSFSFNYPPSQSVRRESALSPAARLLGVHALTCGCNNSALTAVKIDFRGQALPNQHTSSHHMHGFKQTDADACTHVRPCAVFVELSSACWAISLLILILLPVTAGESCQNNCPGSCGGSEVLLVWREQLKEAPSELLSDLSALLRGWMWLIVTQEASEKPAWHGTATKSPFLANFLFQSPLEEACPNHTQFVNSTVI